MNAATILLLAVIALLAALAVRRIRKKKLLFTCGGDCSACQANCKNRR